MSNTNDAVIPHNYETWHHCITVKCKLELTQEFIAERIASLQDDNDFRTQQFINLYGQAYRQSVLGWFKQAQGSL